MHDILLRIGEGATAPEVAHLMLDPRSLMDALAGMRTPLSDLSNRQFVLNRINDVHVDNEDFSRCIEHALALVPPITHQPLFAPQKFWPGGWTARRAPPGPSCTGGTRRR